MAAFGAGFASFISPCCLPLYPSYLSYITGISVTDLKVSTRKQVRMRTMTIRLFFILGFSVVYYTLGYGTNIFAEFFTEYQRLYAVICHIDYSNGAHSCWFITAWYADERTKLPIKPKKSGYHGLLYIRNWVLRRLVTLYGSDIGSILR